MKEKGGSQIDPSPHQKKVLSKNPALLGKRMELSPKEDAFFEVEK